MKYLDALNGLMAQQRIGVYCVMQLIELQRIIFVIARLSALQIHVGLTMSAKIGVWSSTSRFCFQNFFRSFLLSFSSSVSLFPLQFRLVSNPLRAYSLLFSICLSIRHYAPLQPPSLSLPHSSFLSLFTASSKKTCEYIWHHAPLAFNSRFTKCLCLNGNYQHECKCI